MYLYDDKKYIGLKIKQYRKNAAMSQSELSEKVGMTEKNLSNIERGLQLPVLGSFFKIVKVLNIPLSEFDLSTQDNVEPIKLALLKEISVSSIEEMEVFFNILIQIKSLSSSKT